MKEYEMHIERLCDKYSLKDKRFSYFMKREKDQITIFSKDDSFSILFITRLCRFCEKYKLSFIVKHNTIILTKV